MRQSNLNRRKRRSSLFDITTEGPSLPTPSPTLPVMSSHSNSDQEELASFEISSATTAESNAYAKNSEEVAMAGTSGYGEVPFYQGFVAPTAFAPMHFYVIPRQAQPFYATPSPFHHAFDRILLYSIALITIALVWKLIIFA